MPRWQQSRIAGLEEQLKQKEEEARNDQLTGFPIAGRSMRCSRMRRGAQQNGEPLTVVMLDIDHFKRCNDNYGHRGGRRLDGGETAAPGCGAQTLPHGMGEEFILVLPGCSLILDSESLSGSVCRRPIVFESKRSP